MTPTLSLSSAPSNAAAKPLVSVIIDNYNYGRFLRQAIESVLAQTYPHIELIVVDDGSTDDSEEIITSYGDRLVPLFQANGGQGAAVNTGFTQAQGEIICLLDADDQFYPDKVEKVVTAFAHHPDWGQIAHCWTTMNAAGQKLGKNSSNVLSQGKVEPLLLQWGKYASGITSALSYRRSVLQQVMPAPPCCIIDSYLNATVPFYSAVGSLNEILMAYRIHGNNIQARNSNVDYLIQARELIASYINQAAGQVGQSERFDLDRDVDYRAYRAIAQGGVPLAEALAILRLSVQESHAVGRSPRDTGIRLVNRVMCAFFPQQGIAVLRQGMRGYVRTKLSRRSVQEV
jgi:glycosyltransferase involved in cell wall biosynthesis